MFKVGDEVEFVEDKVREALLIDEKCRITIYDMGCKPIYTLTDGKNFYLVSKRDIKPVKYEWLWYGHAGGDCVYESSKYCKTKDEALNEINFYWNMEFKKKHIHKIKGSKRKAKS